MVKNAFAAGALALATLGAFTAAPAAANTSIFVQVAPPAPRYEAAPALRHGQAWVPGHWEWQRNRYVWANGYVVRARPGYHYVAPQWVQHGRGWAYTQGAWARGDRGGRGDRDRDGVPNRFDRDRDNDGVPNRHDRQPNNPYRH